MSAEINFENNTFDFSSLTRKEKEDLVHKLMQKQLQTALFLAYTYGDSNLLHDHAILMAAVKGSNIGKMLTKKLSGEMTFAEASQEFINVLGQCTGLFLIISD